MNHSSFNWKVYSFLSSIRFVQSKAQHNYASLPAESIYFIPVHAGNPKWYEGSHCVKYTNVRTEWM